MNKTHYNIPIFVPHIGCPHDCVFCNQRHITGVQTETTPEEVKNIIEEHLKYIPENSYVEVAFFGGSFTAIDFETQTALMAAAYEYVKSGRVHSLRCSTRPDCITVEILKNAKKYGMGTIELGVQSTDDEVLIKSGRGHSAEAFFTASQLIKENGIDLGLQMMLGLPADTWDKSVRTAEDIISVSPKCVRIYPTLVVEDTALCHMYKKGKYTPISLSYAVELAAHLTEMFENAGIDVIRIGLQTTDNINEKTVIGPYHSAIGELVRSELYKRKIEKKIDEAVDGKLIYTIPKGEISKAVGHKKSNIKYFKDIYGIDLKIVEKI